MHDRTLPSTLFATWALITCPACILASEAPDIRSVAPDLVVPVMTAGPPAAGKRVKQVIPAYDGTSVYHTLYLPTDWKPGRRYPVIIEYAGNGPYQNQYGDVSTGRVEGSKLGFGLSAGKGFIWGCMPYLSNNGTANVAQWWGDRPEYNVRPTLDYCKQAVPWICDQYGGDMQAVILAGFSRGAIACNFVGLHDDDIAKLWAGFVAYSHYDGVVEDWGYPGADRPAARIRLRRMGARPQFICHEWTANQKIGLSATQRYLESTGVPARLTFMETGFRNHNDAWILRPCAARSALREWLAQTLVSGLGQ